jgi:hypothetical protein
VLTPRDSLRLRLRHIARRPAVRFRLLLSLLLLRRHHSERAVKPEGGRRTCGTYLPHPAHSGRPKSRRAPRYNPRLRRPLTASSQLARSPISCLRRTAIVLEPGDGAAGGGACRPPGPHRRTLLQQREGDEVEAAAGGGAASRQGARARRSCPHSHSCGAHPPHAVPEARRSRRAQGDVTEWSWPWQWRLR